MAQDRPVTPEKQLLKLIEDSKRINKDVHAHALTHQGLSLFSFGAWRGRISFLKNKLRNRPKSRSAHLLDIKTVNGILGVCVFIAAVYFFGSVFASSMNMKKFRILTDEVRGKGVKYESPPETAIIKKAVPYYLEKIGSRDIFKMGAKKAAAEAKAEVNARSSAIVEATQNLQLVGISWSDDPDAMIEDTKAMRTYFVKRGNSIGEVKIQAIFKDKVVLSCGGEEIELR